jgi:hypothetical protein
MHLHVCAYMRVRVSASMYVCLSLAVCVSARTCLCVFGKMLTAGVGLSDGNAAGTQPRCRELFEPGRACVRTAPPLPPPFLPPGATVYLPHNYN